MIGENTPNPLTDQAAASNEDADEVVGQANPETMELAPGVAHEALEGWIPSLATEQETVDVLEKAFGYRGDVTITRKDGSVVEGYIFDRRTGPSLKESFVRLYPKDSPDKMTIAYSEIAALAFSGKDRAAGQSWEAWVKKWKERKASGRDFSPVDETTVKDERRGREETADSSARRTRPE